jgi:processive 1,2-diacylglycerol beta-glucosyltransferase
MTALRSFVTEATKQIYLNSLKLSPKIYELLFSQTCEHEWPVKILNFIAEPFMQKKFLELLKQKKPKVLVCTYPLWNILIKKVWKRYGKDQLPFVNVITDSISVHNTWVMAEPDYFIVANEDTKVSLGNYGIPENKIKVFGYPVARRFSHDESCLDIQNKCGLSDKRKTLLLMLSAGISWSKVERIADVIEQSKLKGVQLIVVCSEEKWKSRLAKFAWPWPTFITGRTNEIHSFIHSSDIVLTKAGGATVMECIASKKPMGIIEVIPGHEMGNAILIQKYNIGVIFDEDLKNFDQGIKYILNHGALIKKNLTKQQNPKASDDTAKFLMKLVKKS